MTIPNHPHDERLAALASADADVTGDTELVAHVAACAGCTETVSELRALRASLADLPDLAPPRPLRLLPGVEADSVPAAEERLTGWVRRIFAPVLTVGAAMALVGLVGTTAPLVGSGAGVGSVFQNVGSELEGGDTAAEAPAAGGEGDYQPFASSRTGAESLDGGEEPSPLQGEDDGQRENAEDSEALTTLPADRPLWPMVLFTGVALVIVALLLRWIVLARAG